MRLVKLFSAISLCLLALGAGTAHAAEWSIGGKGLEELKIKSETALGKGGVFKLSVEELGLTIECVTAETSGFTIAPGGTTEGTITLNGCKASGVKFCTFEPIAIKAFGQVAERNSSFYLVLESKSGPLATIVITGKGCVLPKETGLSGNLAGEVKLGESTERSVEFSIASAKAAGTTLTYGVQPATFEGKLLLSLSGAQKGKAWGVAKGAVGLGPGTELDFTKDPVGTIKTITVENVGLPLSTVTMRGEWIERSGLVDEGDFEIVPAGGAEACAMPFKKEKGTTFESLIGNGAKCKVGVKFISGIRGVPGEAYVLEYGPYIFWANIAKFPIKA